MFYPRLSKMGLRPISSGAVRPPPAPLLLCLHPHRNLCAATSVATPSRSFSGAGGYHDPLHWYRLCAVMGTRQRFPEVRTAFGAYPTTFAKCLSGYTSLLEWGLKGRSPFCKLGHVLAHDMLTFPVSSKARNRKVLRCPSIRLAKARQLRLAFV